MIDPNFAFKFWNLLYDSAVSFMDWVIGMF